MATKNIELYYIHRPVVNLTAMKVIDTTLVADGTHATLSDLGMFYLDKDSTETPNDETIIQPDVGSGRWIRSDAKINFPDQKNIVYVGKHGNDANGGKTIEEAKLTFASAATVAVSGNVIVCFDAGTYIEALPSKLGVNVYAPNVTILISSTLTNSAVYQIGTLIISSGTAFGASGSTEVDLTLNNLILLGVANGFYASSSARLYIKIKYAEITSGALFDPTTAGEVSMEFEKIRVVGSGIVMAGTATSSINITGASISDLGAGILFFSSVDTTSSINCTYVNIGLLSVITAGTQANLICSTLSGALNESGAGHVKYITSPLIDTDNIIARTKISNWVNSSSDKPILEHKYGRGTRAAPQTITVTDQLGKYEALGYRGDGTFNDYYTYGELNFTTAVGDIDDGRIKLSVNNVDGDGGTVVKEVLEAISNGTATPENGGLDVKLGGINLRDGSNLKFNSLNQSMVGSANENLTITHSCGQITGGQIVDLGSGNFNVLAGTGYLRETDSDTSVLHTISWTANGGSVPDGEVRYIGIAYFNPTTGGVTFKAIDTWNSHTEFRLGSIVREGSVLHILENPWRAVDPISWINERLYETSPFKRADRLGGLDIGETGTRNITVSGSELYDGSNEFLINNIDTSGSDTYDTYLGAVQDATGITTWDNQNYNNGGVKTALLPSRYANLWFYIEANDNLVMLYGENEYSSIATATAEKRPAIIPLRLQIHGQLIGRLLFQKSGGTSILIDSAYDKQYEAGSVSDHAKLSNLPYDTSAHGNGHDGFLRGATNSTIDPTVNDDDSPTKGYVAGDLWVNTTSNEGFICLDSTTGAAIWQSLLSTAGGGKLVAHTENLNNAWITTSPPLIPYDNTKPQSTEGYLLMALPHAPSNANNILVIQATVNLAANVAFAAKIVALFRDLAPDALTTSTRFQRQSDVADDIHLWFTMTAGTTSTITFKIRVGENIGLPIYINGVSAIPLFDQAFHSSLSVFEFLP